MEKDKIKRRLPKKFKNYRAIINGNPIIITGRQGKTGKTNLKDYLNSFGILAYELWECETVELNVFI